VKKKENKTDVSDTIHKAFSELSKKDSYKLTKILSSRPGSMVGVGNTVSGIFTLIEGYSGEAMLLVDNSAADDLRFSDPTYIRTSPIVAILDKSSTEVVFKTEGGVYKLEKMKASKK